MYDPNMMQGVGEGLGVPQSDGLQQRFAKLSPQDHIALDRGVTPEAAAVIMKLVPELGDVLDQHVNSGPQADAEMADMEAEDGEDGEEGTPPKGMPFTPKKPKTALGDV